HELISMGIPAAAFYASSEQPPELQERIFGELASGLTKKDGKIRFMSVTNAFGMGINISDIRAIIHTTFPMFLDSFIQEIDHAGHDGNGGRNIIFFSRAELQNIEISQEFDESSSLTEMVAPTNQKKHLKEKRKQLLEMPGDSDIPECHNCDNCCQYEAISTEWQNVSNKLLRISRDDIADCFMGSKGKNAVSKDLSSIESYGVSSESCSIFNEDCLYLINSLILAEIITEEVDIKYSKEAKSLSYSSSLVSLKENTLNFVSTLEWKLLMR
ncbi:2281_t:CDS:2, partial [Racocetra persica]